MDKDTILIVDDTPENIDVLRNLLGDNYRIKAALNGEKALSMIGNSLPDLILLDIMMPNMSGYEVCSILKKNHITANIPVIFVTAKSQEEDETKGFELGAVDYITKPFFPAVVHQRVQTQLELYKYRQKLEELVNEKTKQLKETQNQIIATLGTAAEFKDNETGLHVVRMAHFSKILAEEAKLDEKTIDLLYKAAPMHDVGKIGIPDAVLLKPGKLVGEEWVIMQSHASLGIEILGDNDSELLKMAKIIAITHHEKWNGTGYPNKLRGDEIPIAGRIAAIADVFDALTSVRPYKKAWSVERAMNLIKEESGAHFDPALVSLFLAKEDEIVEVMLAYQEQEK